MRFLCLLAATLVAGPAAAGEFSLQEKACLFSIAQTLSAKVGNNLQIVHAEITSEKRIRLAVKVGDVDAALEYACFDGGVIMGLSKLSLGLTQ